MIKSDPVLLAEIKRLKEENVALKWREKALLRGARSGTEDMQRARGREQEFLDIAGVILMALDRNGRVTLMNKKGHAILGYEEGELIGTHWVTMCIPLRVRDEVELVWQGLISGEPEPVEYYENPVLTKQGRERIIAWHNAVLRDEAGTVTGILSSGEDITERRKSEEALQESEEKFKLLFERSADPVLLLDGGAFVDGNEAALRLMGYSRKDQLIGLRPCDLSPERQPDGRLSLEKSQELIDDALREGVTRFEWMHSTFNGEGAWIDVSLTTIPVHGRRIIYTAWRDISERKRAEEVLRESEERYRVAIEGSNDGVSITRDGLHIYINPRFLKMFGYEKAEEVLGKPVGDFIYPEDRQRTIEMNLEKETGQVAPSIVEFVGIRSDGSLIHLESSARKVTYDGGPASLSYLRDVTDRKQAEAQLRESHERLRALAARLQAIREEERASVAREVHDQLGQALTCMKIDLWQIREESSLEQVHKDAVLLKIQSLLGFIDATVDTVRRIASALRPPILDDLGLVPAIEWQLSDFQKRTGITCAFRKPRSLVIDKDCSSALFRVFQESLTNVARHSEAEKVEITLGKRKGELVLMIHDNGKGIRDGEVSGATSLGILGMRERVLPFGGRIHITGKPGKGTRVAVRIPSPGKNCKESQGGHRRGL